MKNIPLILYIVLIFLVVSCGSKKNVTTSVTKVTDTVFIKTETIKGPLVKDIIRVHHLCDSTGKAIEFEKEFIYMEDTLKISTLNNQLSITSNRLARVLKENDSLVKSRNADTKESSEKVKYRTPAWHWWAHLVALLVIGIGIYFWTNRR